MRCSFFIAGCLAVLLAVPARGADTAIESIEVGFAGHYKAGGWTPLAIQLDERAAAGSVFTIETETIDADGSTIIRISPPVRIETVNDQRWLRTVYQAGRLGSGLTIRLRSRNGELLAEKRLRPGTSELPAALRADIPLWVTTVALPERDPESETTWSPELRIVAVSGPLPVDPIAYQAVDLLILPGDLDASDAVFEAIRGYVAGGGRLAITLGDRTRGFETSPLAEWISIETDGTIQLREFSDLEDYANSERRLPARARVRIALIKAATESVLPWEGTGRLIVGRDPHGFGDVTLFAFDFSHPTFLSWTGLPAFIERAIRRSEEPTGTVLTGDVSDLATQLLRAEDNFPGLSRISVGRALLLLLAYAAIVGPLDYLIVHRWLGRPALTWITLPLIVAGAAWWLNSRAIATNGTQSRFNQLTLLDHDLASGTGRGRSIVTLYATSAVRADLTVDPAAVRQVIGADAASQPFATRLGWLAAPEEAFGGLYRDTAGGLFRPEYSITSENQRAQAHEIPLLVWSSRQFEASWLSTGQEIAFTAELASAGRGFLEGTVEHSFAGPIRDWMIVYGNQAYLPAAVEWDANTPLLLDSRAFSRRDLRSLLTGRTQVKIEDDASELGAKYFVTDTAYDPRATDPAMIARMLTFYESAGGATYTKLTNSLWEGDDLTPLLDLGRAVLWGEIEPVDSGVEIDSESHEVFEPARRRTFIRLVLPVKPAGPTPAEPLIGEGD